MNKHQVEKILGKPDQIDIKAQEETWNYKKGIELIFQKEDLYLLGYITLTCTSTKLDSINIIGLTEKELCNSFPYITLEDDVEEIGKNFHCIDKELAVWVTNGIVSNITIFPEYDITGNIPIWPNNST